MLGEYHPRDLNPFTDCYASTIHWMLLQWFAKPQELSEQGGILEVAIRAAANEIIGLRNQLNEWDSKVGDGDCGSTVR